MWDPKLAHGKKYEDWVKIRNLLHELAELRRERTRQVKDLRSNPDEATISIQSKLLDTLSGNYEILGHEFDAS